MFFGIDLNNVNIGGGTFVQYGLARLRMVMDDYAVRVVR